MVFAIPFRVEQLRRLTDRLNRTAKAREDVGERQLERVEQENEQLRVALDRQPDPESQQ
jgi:hypothetical protein